MSTVIKIKLIKSFFSLLHMVSSTTFTQTKGHFCQICGKSFDKASNTWTHKDIVHGKK